jgi:hypothetical protein
MSTQTLTYQPLDVLKAGVGLVTGIGISAIVSAIVKETTPTNNPYQAATVFAGRLGLTMLASEAVRSVTDRKIDSAVEFVKQLRIAQMEAEQNKEADGISK